MRTFLTHLQNPPRHRVQFCHRLRVDKPDHSIALRLQPFCTGYIVRFLSSVHVAIDFDDQSGLRAVEIDDEPANRMLAAKLVDAQITPPQNMPLFRFSAGVWSPFRVPSSL